jgi:hypothetical protein
MLSESTSALSIAAIVWAEDNMLTASRKMSKRSNFITSKMGFPSIHILASNKGKWQFLLWVSTIHYEKVEGIGNILGRNSTIQSWEGIWKQWSRREVGMNYIER